MAVFGAVIVGKSGEGGNLSGGIAYSQLLGFGDSTMDTGYFFTHNISNNTTNQAIYNTAKAAGGGIPTTIGGKMFTTLLAESIGVTATAEGLPGGTNFAASGATITGALPNSLAPSVVAQIDRYLASVSQSADSNALYILSAGGNEAKIAEALSDATAQSNYMIQQAHAYSQSIIKLASAGARYIIVSDQTGPGVLGRFFTDTVWNDLGSAGVSYVPALVVANVFNAVRANPADFGITDTTGFASVNPFSNPLATGWAQYSIALTSPDAAKTYLLADKEHLSAAGQKIEYNYINSIMQTGAPVLNEILSVQNGVVSNGIIGANGGRFTYQWQRNSADKNNWQDISGATSSSYTVSSADIGNQIRAKVVYIEASGATTFTQTQPTLAAREVGGRLFAGDSDNNSLVGTSKNDGFKGGAGNDTLNGGDGFDIANYLGRASDYTVTRNADGSYTVVDKTANRDGTDTLSQIEQLQFSDQTFALSTDLPFNALFAANLSQGKAIAAAYQVLLGGTPAIAGFDFLIKGNLSTNFGAGPGAVFNDENIFINVANSLVQGNATAAAKFATLAAGATLSEKITSLYKSIIPSAKQTAEGVAFLTRPDGLKFYQDVAKERGITAENGPAVIALASLLKVAVDGKTGIGNPVSDLIASIADGSSGVPVTSTAVLPIETIDGTKFDADDAPDAMPGFSGPPPAPLIGVVADEALVYA